MVKTRELRKCFFVGTVILCIFFCGTIWADGFAFTDLRDVNVGGEIGHRIQMLIDENLFKIDIDGDFLEPFRKRELDHEASLRKKRGEKVENYIGVGKLINSLVLLSAYTNDQKLIDLKDYVIEETIKTQQPDGYIGIFQPDARLRTTWDIHEVIYMIYGLTSDYPYFKNQKSLDAALKLTKYLMDYRQVPGKTVGCHVEEVGLEQSFIKLYEATGEKKYLDYGVTRWSAEGLYYWQQPIEGHHSYTYPG